MNDIFTGDLEDIVGALLEVDETGTLATVRARRLVEIAEKAAGEAGERCLVAAFVNGKLHTCTLENGHRGRCSYAAVSAAASVGKPAEGDLGSLDDLLEWVPDPGPIRAEILEILANLPALTELDKVAELVGRLAGLVDAPGGK